MTDKTHVFTQKGYKKAKKEYKELVEKKRPIALEKLKEARGMGNLEDNIQYETAKSDIERIDARITTLEDLLKQSKIVESQKASIISVGSTVTVTIDGEEDVFIIVNPYESNPNERKISYESPVGKALMDKKSGDIVDVALPHTTISYTIIEVK